MILDLSQLFSYLDAILCISFINPSFNFIGFSPKLRKLLEQLLDQGVITETTKDQWNTQRQGMENEIFKNEEDT